MFVRQVKRKCSVRGCRNTDCFAISRTREVGNTVIACKECLGEALKATCEVDPKTKSNIPKPSATDIPSLFFNNAALGVEEKTEAHSTEDEQNEEISSANEQNEEILPFTDDAPEFVCPDCGKEFESEKGVKSHLRYCKGAEEE